MENLPWLTKDLTNTRWNQYLSEHHKCTEIPENKKQGDQWTQRGQECFFFPQTKLQWLGHKCVYHDTLSVPKNANAANYSNLERPPYLGNGFQSYLCQVKCESNICYDFGHLAGGKLHVCSKTTICPCLWVDLKVNICSVIWMGSLLLISSHLSLSKCGLIGPSLSYNPLFRTFFSIKSFCIQQWSTK